jgi:hypothetical protein
MKNEIKNRVWLDGKVWRWETSEAFGTGTSKEDALDNLNRSLDKISPVVFEEDGVTYVA